MPLLPDINGRRGFLVCVSGIIRYDACYDREKQVENLYCKQNLWYRKGAMEFSNHVYSFVRRDAFSEESAELLLQNKQNR